MDDQRLNLNERLTFLVGIGALFVGLASTAIAFLAYRQSRDTAELSAAVRHLRTVADQSANQTSLIRQELSIFNREMDEARAQSLTLGRQAQSLAIQAEQSRSIASANSTMARASIDALSLQQRTLFFAASPRLTVVVQHLDEGSIRGNILSLGMTVLVSPTGIDPVRNYAVMASLFPSRSDGQFGSSIKRTCGDADRVGAAQGFQLEKGNLAGISAHAKLSELNAELYVDQPPRPAPVFIVCASYRSPVDASIHHVAIVNPITFVDEAGVEKPFIAGNLVIPAARLRRVDFPGYSD